MKMATKTCDIVKNRKKFSIHDYKGGISEHILSMIDKTKEIVVLCIGSEKFTGDLLAPYIGTMLEKRNFPYKVYGKLGNDVHARNLVDTTNLIKQSHDNPFIIAIDACGGTSNEIGNIEVWQGGIKAGTGIGNNRLPIVGDVSIAGVTFDGTNFNNIFETSFSIPYQMSEIITEELMTVANTLTERKNIYLVG
jgi:putative sporulation protein YyaC